MRVTPEDLMNAWNVNRGEMLMCSGLEIRNRRRLAESCLERAPELSRWVFAIKRSAGTRFCTGMVKADGHEPFIATFDWLVKPDTLALIEEGQFDDRGPREVTPPEPGHVQRGVKFETWRDEFGRLWARRA